MYKKLKFHIKGVSPLIMHNGELVDPENKWAKLIKEITPKKKKTEEDLVLLATFPAVA